MMEPKGNFLGTMCKHCMDLMMNDISELTTVIDQENNVEGTIHHKIHL